MPKTMSRAESQVEIRFNLQVARQTCPLCGSEFEPRIGPWPHVAGTDTLICGGEGCPAGEEVAGPSPCDTRFAFGPLQAETLAAIRSSESDGGSVAERLRRVALDESLHDPDRALLQLAAIDLQYCEADDTRIERVEPTLILRTCGEAAAEMLLSGCGEILG